MGNSSAEKRKCKRYNVTDFVVAMYSTRLGRLINISENGIAIQLIDEDLESLPDKCKTSFLYKAKPFVGRRWKATGLLSNDGRTAKG